MFKLNVKKILLFLVIVMAMSLMVTAVVSAAPKSKIDICHYGTTETDPTEGWYALSISENGWDKGHHERHNNDGDFDFPLSNLEDEDACLVDRQATDLR